MNPSVSPSAGNGCGFGGRSHADPARPADAVATETASGGPAAQPRGGDEASIGSLGRAALLAPATPARIGSFVLSAWLLALGGIWAAQQVHEGLHEHVDLPPLLHLVRDAALAVPLAALALAVGGCLTVWALKRLRSKESEISGRVAWVVVTAAMFTLLSIPGHEIHGYLFGAEREDLGWLAHAVADGWVVFQAAVVVLLPIAFIPIGPWPPAGAERPWWARSAEPGSATPPEVVALDA